MAKILDRLAIDDALMGGRADAADMLARAREEINAPALQAKRAAEWYALLGNMMPGIPPLMAERRMMQVDKKRYEAAKKRFMEAEDGEELDA